MKYYASPVTYQRGHGIGNVLSRIFKSVVPFFQKHKQGIKRVGSLALKTGVGAVRDHLERGTPIQQSFQKRVRREAKKIVKESFPSPAPVVKRGVGVKSKIARRKKRKLDIFD